MLFARTPSGGSDLNMEPETTAWLEEGGRSDISPYARRSVERKAYKILTIEDSDAVAWPPSPMMSGYQSSKSKTRPILLDTRKSGDKTAAVSIDCPTNLLCTQHGISTLHPFYWARCGGTSM